MSEEKRSHEGNVLLTVSIYFFIANMFERLAYYGLTGQNTYVYSSIFGTSSATASKIHSVFQTIAYITPLIGAILSDQYIGRYKTMLTGVPPYLAGILLVILSQLLSVTTWKEPTGGQTTTLTVLFTFGIMAGIALGAGCLKPNLIVLGADQFDLEKSYQRHQQGLYFSAFYWVTNIAAFTGFFCMSTLAVNGLGKLKGYKNKSLRVLVVALLSAGFLLCSSVSVFVMRAKIFTSPPKGSALLDFMGAVKESWTTNVFSVMAVAGTLCFGVGILVAFLGYFIKSKDHGATSYLSGAIIISGAIMYLIAGQRTEWIENSSTDNGGTYEPKSIVGYRAILSTFQFIPFSILFWLIYNSLNTFFWAQGCVMKTQVFDFYNMPSSQVSAWNCMVIVIFVPIHQKVIYPAITNMGFEMTVLRKSVYGLVWASISMAIAGVIEFFRKAAPMSSSASSCYDSSVEIVMERNFSLLWLIIAYGAIAMSEIGYAVSCYEFYYSQVPGEVRTVVQALNNFTTALGTAASGVVITVFEDWLPDNLDMGHLEIVYFIISGLALINAAGFAFVAYKYDYVDFSGVEIDDDSEYGKGDSDDEDKN